MTSPSILEDQRSLIAFLSKPGVLSESTPHKVDTLGAVVFLAEDKAFKLKRAVSFRFMDFGNRSKRDNAAKAELILNRRTAKTLYLGLTPVYQIGEFFHLGELSEEIDPALNAVAHLVTMRRFKDGQTFDQLVDAGELDSVLIDQLADTIADFHAQTPATCKDAAATSLTFSARRTAKDLLDAKNLLGENSTILVGKIEDALARYEFEITHRGANGSVKRLHGDLHLANVARINNSPVIFDALEFDNDMATVDELHDLAFLIMDLWARNAHFLAARVWSRYLATNGKYEGLALAPLFISMRAAVRAKVALHAVEHSKGKDRESKLSEAKHYVQTALNALAKPKPRLIAIGGLSGSGKTTLAHALAPLLAPAVGAVHLRSDGIRKRRAGLHFNVKLPKSAYSSSENKAVYETLINEAKAVLLQGSPVIVDAVFARSDERKAIQQVAEQLNLPFNGFWLEADLIERQQRIVERKVDISDATPAVAARQENYELGHINWQRLNALESPLAVVIEELNLQG